ncbi:MAG TPA: hypothetical protein VHO70_02515 [Chitinispirillaceae bacterium]|nr:hypothetical protein [Chitinispirillaceae bacterium]
MNATYCINGETQGTFTPVAYQVEQTIENGRSRFTEWLFKDQSTSELFLSYNPALGIMGFRAKDKDNPEYESFQISTKENSVLEKIESKIFNRLVFPAHWVQEGISQPNMASKVKAFEICRELFRKYDIIPDRIAPTKEEGIFLAFDSTSGNRTLLIEVYNDLEAGYLINENSSKKILASNDIKNFDFNEAVDLLNG